jgi:regulator of nonsense transcripts 2
LLYIFTKSIPPIDIDFLVLDTFDKLRPKMKMLENYAEAAEQINTMIDQSQLEPEMERGCDDENESSADESSADEEIHDEIDDDDEEVDYAKDDHDFDKEFSKLVAESMDHRKVEKKVSAFDTPIPFKMKRSLVESNEAKVSFTLITKRGNKPQVCHMTANHPVKTVLIAYNEYVS